MRKLALALFVWVAASLTAAAQINLPNEVPGWQPIIAGCNCVVPEGAEVTTRWTISPESVKGESTLLQVGEKAHIWGRPGRHHLTAQVVWLHFEYLEVKLADGSTKKIRNLISWDSEVFDHRFTIMGSVNPDPDPDPDPTPGPRWILMVDDYSQRPVDDRTRADLWSDIRGIDPGDNTLVQVDEDRKDAQGNVPAWFKPYQDLLDDRSQSVPAIIIVDKDTSKVLYVGDAPDSTDDYDSLLEQYGG